MSNREIKFRALDNNNNKIFYPKRVEFVRNESLDPLPIVNGSNFHWNFVMQFTGLKDKNGKEIYEKDIIEFSLGGSNKCKRVVQFSSAEFIAGNTINNILIEDSNLDGCEVRGDSLSEFDFKRTFTNGSFNFEVIGNIYENPDLINS